MGHVECCLIHACSVFFFFFHDRTTCMHGLVVGLTMKGSFACAPRWGVAFVGFISIGR